MTSPATAATGVDERKLDGAAVPLLILAFAIATSSIVMPVIAFVIWLQRRKLFPNFAAPWEDPMKVKAWAERLEGRRGDSPTGRGAVFAAWLRDPPYSDKQAFRAWVRRRIGQASLGILGLALVVRAMTALG